MLGLQLNLLTVSYLGVTVQGKSKICECLLEKVKFVSVYWKK